MRKMRSVRARQLVAAGVLSAAAVAGMIAALGQAHAADLSVAPSGQYRQVVVNVCTGREVVILFDERGYPTIPARTPYYYCAVGTTLLAGDIPPPREYCCS